MKILIDTTKLKCLPSIKDAANIVVDSSKLNVLSEANIDDLHLRAEYLYKECVDRDINLVITEDAGVGRILKSSGVEVLHLI